MQEGVAAAVAAPRRYADGDFVRVPGHEDAALVLAAVSAEPGPWWYRLKTCTPLVYHNAPLSVLQRLRQHAPALFSSKLIGQWVQEPRLEPHVVVPSAFPLLELPTHVLARVMLALDLRHVAALATVCRKFNAAVNDETHWRARCESDIQQLDRMDERYIAERVSWKQLYIAHAFITVRVVEVVLHRGLRTLSSDFSLYVRPSMTVREFELLVGLRASSGPLRSTRVSLRPHDPRQLTNPQGPPNCTWNATRLDASIVEAGLCDGAVLERPGGMKLD